MELKELQNITTIGPKETITKESNVSEGTYPIINSSREYFGLIERFNNKGNSVVVTSHGVYAGFSHYLDRDFFAGSLCYPMKSSNEKIIPTKYIYYFLKHNESLIREKYVNKSGVPYIKFKSFMTIKVPIYSQEKHQSIVATLDKINELIDANKRQLELLDEAVKARFNDLFGDPIQNELKLPTQKLNSIISINSIKTPIKPNINGEVWLLNLDMIESNTGNLISHNFVKPSIVGNSTVKFDQECVLYSKLRPYLNKVVVPDVAGYATSEILVMKPSNKINKHFLASLLRHQSFVSLVDSSSYGAKMPRASVDLIKEFDLLTPSFDLQIQFEEFFLKTSILKNLIKEQIICSEEILNKKMDEYFGGDSNA